MELRALESKLAAQSDLPLKSEGGGGNSGYVDDTWKKNVEEQLRRNADDIRALLRGIVAAGLILVGMIVGLYVYTGTKFDVLNAQISAVRVEQAQARGDGQTINATINGKLDRITDRLPK